MLSSASIEALVNTHLDDSERRLVHSLLAQLNNCDVNPEEPDPEKTPLFLAVHRHQGTLTAGDLLFIPYGWTLRPFHKRQHIVELVLPPTTEFTS